MWYRIVAKINSLRTVFRTKIHYYRKRFFEEVFTEFFSYGIDYILWAFEEGYETGKKIFLSWPEIILFDDEFLFIFSLQLLRAEHYILS